MAEIPEENVGDAYADPLYAASFQESGTARRLPRCEGSLVVRPIPGSPSFDAMGPYPLFACRDWSALAGDLDELGDLVSVVLVTDPMAHLDLERMRRDFDVFRPYKTHYIVDLDQHTEGAISNRHRRYSHRALQRLTVETCPVDEALDEWSALYAHLIERHQINDLRRFSRATFKAQLALPGSVLLRARLGERTVAMDWYLQTETTVYRHLAALAPEGYDHSASYGLVHRAIDLFRGRRKWLDLGAGAGTQENSSDGLTFWKRGWTRNTATAYLCGKVLDRTAYRTLAKGPGATTYFPAYRAGEFG